MSAFFHSIRWRVQAWHGLILLVVILAFCFTAHRLAWNNQMRRVDRDLTRTEHTLIRTLMDSYTHQSPGVSDPKAPAFSPGRLLEYLRTQHPVMPPEITAMFRNTEPGFIYFSLRDAEGHILLQSTNAPEDLTLSGYSQLEPDGGTRIYQARFERVRIAPEGLRSVIGVDLTPEREGMHRFALSLGAVGLGVWLLGLLGGWWLSGRAILPIKTISATATRIANGNLQERISTGGTNSELDQLGHVLNHTFDRLHATLERQKQFTADASHELRTPVTILLSETQRTLKHERTPEAYRAVIETCRDTAGRMRQLIEALLLLARQESLAGETPRRVCDLATIAGTAITQLQAFAAERGLRLHSRLQRAPCLGDPDTLSILVTNLIANAIGHHHRPDGIVHVDSWQQDERVYLTVKDDGPGIPAADLPHIFERFYRVDQARTGGSGHAGLGLAIARTIAENHRGSITAENNPDGGACFTVTLPQAEPAQ